MPITVRQLTPVFGAEITNVDLTRALNDATFAEVENAFETYSVLVFPRQNLNDESQIAFSSSFGPLETTQGHIANNFTVKQVSVISNLDPNGRLMAADDLVTYDNRAALHRARPYAITEHPRILHRTTVAGDAPTVN